MWLTVERFFEFSSNESSSLLFSIPLKTEHTTTTTTMVQLIGNFDFGALCLPTVPWGKSTRKMQFFRKVRFYLVCLFSSPPRILVMSSANFPLWQIINSPKRRRRCKATSKRDRVQTANAFDAKDAISHFLTVF